MDGTRASGPSLIDIVVSSDDSKNVHIWPVWRCELWNRVVIQWKPDGVVVVMEREVKTLPVVGCPPDRLPIFRSCSFLYFYPGGPVGCSAEANSVISVRVPCFPKLSVNALHYLQDFRRDLCLAHEDRACRESSYFS